MSDDPSVTARPETSLSERPSASRGAAPIKKEYLLDITPTVELASTEALNSAAPYSAQDDDAEGSVSDPRDSKRRKTDKKKQRGQNKARHFPISRESNLKMCRQWEQTGVCKRDTCRFAHSWTEYFATKPEDIPYSSTLALSTEPPYVEAKERTPGGDDDIGKTLDLGTQCPVYRDIGWCPYSWRCRYLGGHIKQIDEPGEAGPSRIGKWEIQGREEKKDGKWVRGETNWTDYDVVGALRSGAYSFPYTEKYLKHVEPEKPFKMGDKLNNNKNNKGKRNGQQKPQTNGGAKAEEAAMNRDDEEAVMNAMNGSAQANGHGVVDGESESMDVPLRPEEKRRLPFDGGLYLAPLTTVGNLPFRRLCVSYGADITCAEMALAQPLVTGHADEFALLRRHESEKTFGVQIAGGYANRMVPTAEMIAREFGSGVDFVDVNLGCPIDLVFNQGAGSALLDAPGRLGKLLLGMNHALGDIPLTVKFRTGVANNKPNAHKLIPRFATEWGTSAMTLHGRSRQQRYSKLADWAYIKECVTTLRAATDDAGLPRIPMYGNGDCFSAQSYYEEKEQSGVDGVMIARGALIKPWIFTEVKERREWDISATERLEGIRKFAEYGLSHWGSDTQGISKTRRFLCEALSFQHRYIPLGLLERLPPMLNERPPAYRGRNELETLLSSPFSGDWVKISEMFLGKVEDGWGFVPKHKSNAYGSEEAQG